MRIRHLYRSPDHNFFGHHGRPPGQHPMIECQELECVAGQGIKGDRFFGYRPNYKGQITFFSWEVYLSLCQTLDVHDRGPEAFRRNVIVEEMDLVSLETQEFEVQGVRFHGTGECTPCYWMNQAFHAGAEQALQGCGGLRARILEGGILRVGDAGTKG